MEVTFPINKLLKLGLTPDEYSICLLLEHGKYGLLKDLVKLKDKAFYDNVKKLNELGYIKYNTIGHIVDVKDITITEEFKKLVAFKDLFQELYNLYPIKVKRPEGEYDYLRQRKNKAKTKYNKIINKDPMLHDHILECLEYEIKLKKDTNSMGYFKRMYNWLEDREWEKYEDKLHNIYITTKPTDNEESVAYGEKFI
jgi:hypothetical protein